jgi:hypothetical protein
MVRRSIAAGAGVIVLVLLVLAFRGCLDSRKESAFRDYSADVTALVRESNQQSEALFQLITEAGEASDVDVTNELNALARQSEQFVERAEGADVPDELASTDRFLVSALEFRRNGVLAIAERLPALRAQEDGGDSQGATSGSIASSMRSFLVSDVIYNNRVLPGLTAALDSEGLLAETQLPRSEYLPTVDWVLPSTIAERVGSGGGGGGGDEAAAPGLHGNGLDSVAVAGQAVAADTSLTVPLTGDVTFDLTVANQGENDESDVGIAITIGSGADAITIDQSIDAIAAGEVQTLSIPLAEEPATGQNVPITVEVEPVPGEEDTANNSIEFSAIFTP